MEAVKKFPGKRNENTVFLIVSALTVLCGLTGACLLETGVDAGRMFTLVALAAFAAFVLIIRMDPVKLISSAEKIRFICQTVYALAYLVVIFTLYESESYAAQNAFYVLFPLYITLVIYTLRSYETLGLLTCAVSLVLPITIIDTMNTNGCAAYITAFIMVAVSVFSGWFSCKKRTAIIIFSVTVLLCALIILLYFDFLFRIEIMIWLDDSPLVLTNYSSKFVEIVANSKAIGTCEAILSCNAQAVLDDSNYALVKIIGSCGYVCAGALVLLQSAFIVLCMRKTARMQSDFSRYLSRCLEIYFALRLGMSILTCFGFGFRDGDCLPLMTPQSLTFALDVIFTALLISVICHSNNHINDDIERRGIFYVLFDKLIEDDNDDDNDGIPPEKSEKHSPDDRAVIPFECKKK